MDLLSRINRTERNALIAYRLKSIKGTINNACPESYEFKKKLRSHKVSNKNVCKSKKFTKYNFIKFYD